MTLLHRFVPCCKHGYIFALEGSTLNPREHRDLSQVHGLHFGLGNVARISIPAS